MGVGMDHPGFRPKGVILAVPMLVVVFMVMRVRVAMIMIVIVMVGMGMGVRRIGALGRGRGGLGPFGVPQPHRFPGRVLHGLSLELVHDAASAFFAHNQVTSSLASSSSLPQTRAGLSFPHCGQA